MGETEEESEQLLERNAARHFVTAGDLVVVNKREREIKRKNKCEEARKQGEGNKETAHGNWSVCVCWHRCV